MPSRANQTPSHHPPTESRASLKLGSVLAGRYRIMGVLGEGGMGAVYTAIQLDLQREVAIKIIARQGMVEGRKRFEREARVAAAIRHHGVVGIYDYGECDGMLYLVMEALTGPALRDEVDGGSLMALPRAFELIVSVAETLSVAASHGAVHRDLKPENIVFDRRNGEERAVLVDFGLAFIQDGSASSRVTRAGVIAGTPDYLSPEQARGDATITCAADVYALGCLLFELLTGQPPFAGDPGTLIAQHLYAAPPRVAAKRRPTAEPVPGAVEDLLRQMLAKNPLDRPSAAQVVSALGAIDPRRSTRSSERGGTAATRFGREARMISVVAERPKPTTHTVVRLGVLGLVPDAVQLELAVAGVEAECRGVDDVDGLDALFVPAAALDVLEACVRTTLPVVVELPDHDIADLQTLLRLGVADVVKPPWSPADLGRRVRRAVKSARRKNKRH